MIRAYISGPMTGLPDLNYPAFYSLEEWIDEYGLDGVETDTVKAVNPARNFGGDPSRPYPDYMRADLRQLADCDAIVLLPGWEGSIGARLEVEIARHLEVDFYHALPDGWDDVWWSVAKFTAPPVRPSAPPQIVPELDEHVNCQMDCLVYDCASPDACCNGIMEHPDELKAPELIELEAAKLVRGGERQANYGHPRGDFGTIAALWSPLLKVEVTAELVALCMIALKMARLTSNPTHHDSLVDVIGYAICYSRLGEPVT